MGDHELDLTTFEAGVNIYTGTVQGGHTYAKIITPEGTRVELERIVDEAFLRFARSTGDHTYSLGDVTMRFDSQEDALEVARAWMREHAPLGRLVGQMDSINDGASTVLYPQDEQPVG